MSALESRSHPLAGLTLDAILGGDIRPPQPPPQPQKQKPKPPVTRQTSRTLFEIIKEENKEGHRDKKTWKTFREKLRLKRTGSAWTSSLPTPASDIPVPKTNHRKNHRFSHRGSFRSQSVGVIHETAHRQDLIDTVPMSDPPVSSGRPMFTRGSSMRTRSTNHPDDSVDVSMPGEGPPSRSFKPQVARHGSIRNHGDGEEENTSRHPVVKFAEERTLSAREAVAAQEAAEAEAAAATAAAAAEKKEEDEDGDEEEEAGETEKKEMAAAAQPVTMSLMDLLEDYDDYDDEDYDEDEEDNDEGDDHDDEDGGEGEFNCCVCMVKIKGAAFIPCGHTFCRLCSRELMVQKGHCPVCTSFVLEFLEIF